MPSEKDRKLLGRLHVSSDTGGTNRRAGYGAEHERDSQLNHQTTPDPLVAQSCTRRTKPGPDDEMVILLMRSPSVWATTRSPRLLSIAHRHDPPSRPAHCKPIDHAKYTKFRTDPVMAPVFINESNVPLTCREAPLTRIVDTGLSSTH